MTREPIFEVYQHRNGGWKWRLLDARGAELAASMKTYGSKAVTLAAINQLVAAIKEARHVFEEVRDAAA